MIEQENFSIIEPPVLVGFEVLKVEADSATGDLRRNFPTRTSRRRAAHIHYKLRIEPVVNDAHDDAIGQ